jgi:hypothetical protein
MILFCFSIIVFCARAAPITYDKSQNTAKRAISNIRNNLTKALHNQSKMDAGQFNNHTLDELLFKGSQDNIDNEPVDHYYQENPENTYDSDMEIWLKSVLNDPDQTELQKDFTGLASKCM